MLYSVVDSIGKPPSGVLEGTLSMLGAYDQCLKISVPRKSSSKEKKPIFEGKYCLAEYQLPLMPNNQSNTRTSSRKSDNQQSVVENLVQQASISPQSALRHGLCVPSTCSNEDVDKIIRYALKSTGMISSIRHCNVRTPNPILTEQIIALAIVGIIGVLVLMGTCLDGVTRSTIPIGSKIQIQGSVSGTGLRFLLMFSLYTNTKKFLHIGNTSDGLSALHGIRFLTAAWVILGHTYFLFRIPNYRRLHGFLDFAQNSLFAPVENFTVSVDTFFFLSGLLLVYSNWKRLQSQNGCLNILKMYLHRYWRLTPAYGFCMVLVFLLPLLGSGPLWHVVINQMVDNCRHSWWKNLLYINNFWNMDDICIRQSWYQSAAIQYHVVFVVILLMLFRWHLVGLLLNGCVALVGIAYTGILVYKNAYPPTIMIAVRDLSSLYEFGTEVYIKPFHHVGAYCVGVAFGFLLVKHKNLKFHPLILVLGWLSATACILAVIYGLNPYRSGTVATPIIAALYSAAHRTVWACGVGWIVTMCATGQGGIINQFLSWSLFVPLGKLSFLAYLLHPLVMTVHNAHMRERVYLDHYEMIYTYLGHLLVTFGVAFICFVTVETPFILMENLFCKKEFKADISEQHNGGNNNKHPLSVIGIKHRELGGTACKLEAFNNSNSKDHLANG
ncbi:nose resistant to fluoxetine protein 6-like isoform X1 [Limulus polyphemus]|uniref:Nose resistant to fluoxetine protein 6-like isoform X1 n=1 Tax=Limulus polyphemus TaxID=6850 RepID=A0ABM1SJR0_LIMPO|nr:nose resistant to fluoxetine protein 6-like isoform X1 [Limulus polyphemus]